ncbi:MAG: signal transduction histidine kinase [Porticoccaceae bacterium]|jgi:signal transduction histidine kinase
MTTKILIAEDEGAIREELVELLTDNGYECVEAVNGEEGLEILRRDKEISIVLSDMLMPGKSGLEMINAALTEIDKDRHLEFIIMMGHGGVKEAIDALRLGVMDFLVKPIDIDLLLNVVRRAEELVLANIEKDQRAEELVIANEEKDKRVTELVIANKEKDQRAEELVIANKEKDKRVAELVIANKEKDQRAKELVIANIEKEKVRQEADKAKSEFISTVSHELRTPLTAIKGALGLMQSGVLDKKPEKLPAIVDIAYKNANRLNHLIDDILDIERLNVGKMNFHMESVDVSSLLEEAALSIEAYGSQYGVTFVCAGTDEPLLVNGDHHRLIQVMANLLSNAVKFSHRDGQVDLSVRRHDGSIRVSVQDYGIGIPEPARASIFDNFTQVDSSDQRNTGGSGLGLGIAKKIVEAHDSEINFTSEVDKGTTFYFDLPALVVSTF